MIQPVEMIDRIAEHLSHIAAGTVDALRYKFGFLDNPQIRADFEKEFFLVAKQCYEAGVRVSDPPISPEKVTMNDIGKRISARDFHDLGLQMQQVCESEEAIEVINRILGLLSHD